MTSLPTAERAEGAELGREESVASGFIPDAAGAVRRRQAATLRDPAHGVRRDEPVGACARTASAVNAGLSWWAEGKSGRLLRGLLVPILTAVAVVLGAFAGAAAPPQRVVVAGIPLYSEIMISLGLAHRIVGVAESPENPPELARVPRVGTVWEPSLEAIVALSPDLVLGPSPLLRDKLRALGLATLSGGGEAMWITDIAGVLDTIVLVGRALGAEREAELLAGAIAREILVLEARVLGAERPSAAVLYLYDPAGTPYVAGRGTPEDEVISRGGGVNAFRDLHGYLQVGVEAILARDPAVLFVGTGQSKNLVRHVTLRALTAVREGRVFEIAASRLLSTRVVEVLARVARALHPGAFREGD